MDLKIRPLKHEDLEEVTHLWIALMGEHAQRAPEFFTAYDANRSRKTTQFALSMKSSFDQVWVADIEGAIVGYCSAFVSYDDSMFHTNHDATLGDIYVAPEHRSKGIGTMLFNEALAFARMMEAHSLTLHVHASNTEAIDYYHQRGMRERFRLMEVRV